MALPRLQLPQLANPEGSISLLKGVARGVPVMALFIAQLVKKDSQNRLRKRRRKQGGSLRNELEPKFSVKRSNPQHPSKMIHQRTYHYHQELLMTTKASEALISMNQRRMKRRALPKGLPAQASEQTSPQRASRPCKGGNRRARRAAKRGLKSTPFVRAKFQLCMNLHVHPNP